MRSLLHTLLFLFSISVVKATPIPQMNRAFLALSDIIPFLTDRGIFVEKKNEAFVVGKITELQSAFKDAKHDGLLKGDLFAPSYAIINESIQNSLTAFKEGKKDYAHWRLKEITTHCLDCHTRLPPSHASSFQNGELTINEKKFNSAYNLGLAQLIVRRYVDAKNSFVRAIQDQLITKDYKNIINPFKQILLIDTKVQKDPAHLLLTLRPYEKKTELPEDVRQSIKAWMNRLGHWKQVKVLETGIESDEAVNAFINTELIPLKNKSFLDSGNDVDLLISSGLLSNYLFTHPSSKMVPEINFWLGWIEKFLKRENFFGSGDLFLKQCIRRYSQDAVAKKCLAEYRESIEFEFSGSAGTNIPLDIQKELEDLEKLTKKK